MPSGRRPCAAVLGDEVNVLPHLGPFQDLAECHSRSCRLRRFRRCRCSDAGEERAWTKLGGASQLVPMPSTGTFWPVLPSVTMGRPALLARLAGPRRSGRATTRRSARGRGRFEERTPTASARPIHPGRPSCPPSPQLHLPVGEPFKCDAPVAHPLSNRVRSSPLWRRQPGDGQQCFDNSVVPERFPVHADADSDVYD